MQFCHNQIVGLPFPEVAENLLREIAGLISAPVKSLSRAAQHQRLIAPERHIIRAAQTTQLHDSN
jgi:hypothetical protein